jgi:hypothetical protein
LKPILEPNLSNMTSKIARDWDGMDLLWKDEMKLNKLKWDVMLRKLHFSYIICLATFLLKVTKFSSINLIFVKICVHFLNINSCDIFTNERNFEHQLVTIFEMPAALATFWMELSA